MAAAGASWKPRRMPVRSTRQRIPGAAGPNATFPNGYLRVPIELWTGFWVVPDDAETGMITYTMTATDRFGRKASFKPFPDIGSQVYIVD